MSDGAGDRHTGQGSWQNIDAALPPRQRDVYKKLLDRTLAPDKRGESGISPCAKRSAITNKGKLLIARHWRDVPKKIKQQFSATGQADRLERADIRLLKETQENTGRAEEHLKDILWILDTRYYRGKLWERNLNILIWEKIQAVATACYKLICFSCQTCPSADIEGLKCD